MHALAILALLAVYLVFLVNLAIFLYLAES